jgi:hypothetical protein
VEQKINMKKTPHKEQVEMLLGLYRYYFERINIEWENHLEFIKWNKSSEFYERFEVFSIRYLWEIIKEQNITYITCFNTLVNYVEINDNINWLKNDYSLNERLPHLCDEYLKERKLTGWKGFEKEFHNPYYVIVPIKYTSKFASKSKRKINWENIFLQYIVGGLLIIILLPFILIERFIYQPISNWYYKRKNSKYQYFYD